MAEADDDQVAALRRLPAAFGFVEVASNDPAAAPAAQGPTNVTPGVVSPR